MARRFFLLAGFACAAGGCSPTVVTFPGSDTGGSHHGGPGVGAGGSGSGSADAGDNYVDPGCPDAGKKQTMFECDPYNQNNGNCPPGEGCYIFSIPPQTTCGEEVYGAQCSPQGTGTQGDPCGNAGGCAAGFTCVVTGAGTQCIRLCELQGGMGCPDGLVCEPIDVQGFGGCL
jgi:hypothetical protein